MELEEGLKRLNAFSLQKAYDEFFRCCGSSYWTEAMVHGRPYRSPAQVYGRARSVWDTLPQKDWLEAFKHHPKLGDLEAVKTKFQSTSQWAASEQAGAVQAGDGVLKALAEGNKAYEQKFGFIFILCATDKSAVEILVELHRRIQNDKMTEIRAAAAEQAKITRLRLEKLLKSC